MKAKKENKVYTINTEQEKQRYLKDGYDVYDDDGNIAEYSPKKKISFSEYMKAVREIERLQALVPERNTETEEQGAETGQRQQPEQEPDKKTRTKKVGE